MQYLVHSAPHNPLAENLVTIKFFLCLAAAAQIATFKTRTCFVDIVSL